MVAVILQVQIHLKLYKQQDQLQSKLEVRYQQTMFNLMEMYRYMELSKQRAELPTQFGEYGYIRKVKPTEQVFKQHLAEKQ